MSPLRLLVALISFAAGCGTMAARDGNSWIDRGTGVTFSIADQLMVFARTEGQYSLSARDYVYVGPVETNRQGLREYYLWVGVATTLDRGFLAPQTPMPVSLIATLQGEPVEFPLEPWQTLFPSSGAEPVYATKVALQGALGARVTLDQIRLLDSGQPGSVRTIDTAGRSRLYGVWEGLASWRDFGDF